MCTYAKINHGFSCISGTRRIKDTAFIFSKRQSCVSHSTPEAEIVAMDSTIRFLALPLVQIVDEVFGITKIQIMGGITRECCA